MYVSGAVLSWGLHSSGVWHRVTSQKNVILYLTAVVTLELAVLSCLDTVRMNSRSTGTIRDTLAVVLLALCETRMFITVPIK